MLGSLQRAIHEQNERSGVTLGGAMAEFVTTGERFAKEGEADAGAVQQHVAEFHPAELAVVRVVGT